MVVLALELVIRESEWTAVFTNLSIAPPIAASLDGNRSLVPLWHSHPFYHSLLISPTFGWQLFQNLSKLFQNMFSVVASESVFSQESFSPIHGRMNPAIPWRLKYPTEIYCFAARFPKEKRWTIYVFFKKEIGFSSRRSCRAWGSTVQSLILTIWYNSYNFYFVAVLIYKGVSSQCSQSHE